MQNKIAELYLFEHQSINHQTPFFYCAIFCHKLFPQQTVVPSTFFLSMKYNISNGIKTEAAIRIDINASDIPLLDILLAYYISLGLTAFD